MHVIIPMSGMGKRFVAAGYQDPKPLIVVDGKPIIEHVINLFPGQTKFTFICNTMHLEQTNMRLLLQRLAPGCTIMPVPYTKRGPVWATLQAIDYIDDHEEVIVNYCDFSAYWDYYDFLRHTRMRNADGAIPAYKGFHPHMLGSTNYAFIKEENQWFQAIKEKEPFTTNRMQEYASNGTYYFKKGAYIKRYFQELMDLDIHVNGEYYVSLVYNLLARDGLKTSIYQIQHMLQWGTPEDLEEYQTWSDCFACMVKPGAKYHAGKSSVGLIPLAGRGSRFVQDGYSLPKPLIRVSGLPMVVQAASALPYVSELRFVCLQEHLNNTNLSEVLNSHYPTAKVIGIDAVTQGQACTAYCGLQDQGQEESLFVAACDNTMLWDEQKYFKFLADYQPDAVVFSFRRNSASKRNPFMYSYVRCDKENNVLSVSLKKPVSDNPANDHIVIGAFYFKKIQFFTQSLNRLKEKNRRVNGEFYIDSCLNEMIEMGLKVKVFEVDYYIGWGTPNDLKTFEYWQSFFHKCSWHSYQLDKDVMMNPIRLVEYDVKYRAFAQDSDSMETESNEKFTKNYTK